MSLENSSSPKLKEFFVSMTRQSFDQLGVGDRQIVDYVASVLADFSHADRWRLLRDVDGRRLTSVVEMLIAQLGPQNSNRILGERALRKHIGDYTLFMSGLFRNFVERGGYLQYYLEEGKRAYQAVSELDVSLYRPGFLMFEELSKGFENYAGALDYMRKCYFAPSPGENPFAGFLKQLEHWMSPGPSNN